MSNVWFYVHMCNCTLLGITIQSFSELQVNKTINLSMFILWVGLFTVLRFQKFKERVGITSKNSFLDFFLFSLSLSRSLSLSLFVCLIFVFTHMIFCLVLLLLPSYLCVCFFIVFRSLFSKYIFFFTTSLIIAAHFSMVFVLFFEPNCNKSFSWNNSEIGPGRNVKCIRKIALKTRSYLFCSVPFHHRLYNMVHIVFQIRRKIERNDIHKSIRSSNAHSKEFSCHVERIYTFYYV